ncbi:hypothetical protein Pcinc_020323 [Petrolisthes cinctipes]|uniref:Uncharacterized protein n=1 Tax=Petrolisthes cinctipes TaxID=88211 RepID=A0AAE1FJD1_PETCI|nr:hypothetical protein Pcinc_020323 [Petrolisthes cinctipes]
MICLWKGKVSRTLLVSHKFVSSSPAGSRTARPTSSSYRNKGDNHAKNEEKDGNSKEKNLSRKRGHLTPGSRLVSILPQKYWEEEALEVKEVIEKVAGSLLIEDTQTAAQHYESENGNSNRNFVTGQHNKYKLLQRTAKKRI